MSPKMIELGVGVVSSGMSVAVCCDGQLLLGGMYMFVSEMLVLSCVMVMVCVSVVGSGWLGEVCVKLIELWMMKARPPPPAALSLRMML